MAAPTFVPADPADTVRWYRSAPRRPDPWVVSRPGELDGPQPVGDGLGTPGPDAGYALTLAAAFRGTLTLRPGEHESDAIAGGAAVAMKRAGLLGRAPVAHDLRVGLGVWGFLDDSPAAELVELRRDRFDEVHLTHHYPRLRRIADAVPEEVLLMGHTEILELHGRDWRSCLDLTV